MGIRNNPENLHRAGTTTYLELEQLAIKIVTRAQNSHARDSRGALLLVESRLQAGTITSLLDGVPIFDQVYFNNTRL